jgi:hypothetical protein
MEGYEALVSEIRRNTRRKFSVEDKIRINKKARSDRRGQFEHSYLECPNGSGSDYLFFATFFAAAFFTAFFAFTGIEPPWLRLVLLA